MSSRTAVLIVVLGLLPASLPRAMQPVDAGAIHDGRVRMTPPPGWIEIPRAHLDELTYWTADATAGRIVEIYQHGFRPRQWPDDPGLPHLLVQVRRDGRQDLRTYLALPTLDSLRDETRAAFRGGVPPLVMGVQVEQVWFDRDRLALRLEHGLDLRIRGRVRVLTAAFLTEEGFIVLHYLDRERRLEDGRAVFQAVVDSVEIAPDLALRPRVIERYPGLPFFAAAGIVLIVLLLYLAHRSRRRS